MEPHAPIPEVVVSSFAFKTGAPEANLVLDVRFLPDPRAFMEHVPALDGTHTEVGNFIRTRTCFDKFFEVLKDQVVAVVTELRSRGCDRMSFAFGCTGGQHRSVFVAEQMAEWLRQILGSERVYVHHRELSPRSSTYFEMHAPMECLSPASSLSSGCNSPTSNANRLGPTFKCTYYPDSNVMSIDEDDNVGHSISTEDVSNMLGSGLDRVKALREKRRKA